jgi:two-component system, NarL family, nitrate/nitrite response regulator NarL
MIVAPIEIIRVMLVEDHAVVRAGLRLLIEGQSRLMIVGEAADRAGALEIAVRERPDVVLLDLDLGAERGLDLLPVLMAAAPNARIVILTGMRDVSEHHQAVAQGAVGLVHKEQAPEVLLRAIEKVHSGEVWLERSMLANVLNEMVLAKARPSNPEMARNATLTEREREVIALVGEGLKNKQIGGRLSISEITVRHHLTSIFSKLGVESRLEMVISAHRYGLTKLPLHS